MNKRLTLMLTAPIAVSALAAPPKAHRWQDAEPSVGPTPNLPTDLTRNVVMVDTFTTYIHYLFEPQQALILPLDDIYYLYWAYNDGYSHVRVRVFFEDQFLDPGSGISEDIYEWTGDGGLRYVSPSAYWAGVGWYPEATFNTNPASAIWYMMDEGGLMGGIWSNPYDLFTQYDCDLPITWTGPNFVVYMLARNTNLGGYQFVAHQGGSVFFELPVLQFVYSQGYENSQLVYHEGTNEIVVAAGGYRTEDIGAPDSPLLAVYQESIDGGET